MATPETKQAAHDRLGGRSRLPHRRLRGTSRQHWPRLTDAHERKLVLAAASGDPEARSQLVEAFRPGIGGVARLYRGAPHVSREELMQEGVVGLLRALERYDPELGTPFWAYASWWVRQAMQQVVSELGRSVVLSDRAVRRLARIRDARRELLQSLGREPSTTELARRTELTHEQVEKLVAVERAPRALDETAGDRDGSIGTLRDLIADPVSEDGFQRVDDWSEIDQLQGLPGGLADRERHIVRAHYGLDGRQQTLREIAAGMGISVERVRQLEERALGKLRAVVSN